MALSIATAPELTAEQVQRILVQPLEQASAFLAAGPRLFDPAGPLRIPKLGGPVTDPGWTGENELIPERDVTFDEVSLLPSTMKSVKILTRFSNELARQSVSVSTPRCVTAWSGTSRRSSTRSSSVRPVTASPRRRACSRTPAFRPRPWVARSPSMPCWTPGVWRCPRTSTRRGSAG